MPKYLVTGGTGFVGANLVRELVRRREEVHITLRKTSHRWRVEDIQDRVAFHTLDLADIAATQELMAKLKPDLVFHCAAEATNPGAVPAEGKVIAGNVAGTAALAEAAAQNGCIFINTGSSSEYGLKDKPMKETDILEPLSIYGKTKSEATAYVSALGHKFRAPLLTLRLFSAYGYYEDGRRLIPALTLALLRQTRFQLLPTAVRDFVFIEDIVAAYFHFAAKARDYPGEVFNIGTGKMHTAQEVLNNLRAALHNPPLPGYDEAEPKQAEPRIWVADMAKAAQAGWKAAVSMEEGLLKTANWFRGNQHLYSK